jgi:uncharacterized protein YaaN involved in tellurite resistance
MTDAVQSASEDTFDDSVLNGVTEPSQSQSQEAVKSKVNDADNDLLVTTTNDTQMSMSFYNALSPKTRAILDQEAAKSFSAFMDSDDKIVDFGKDSVEGLNNVVRQLLENQKKMHIPEIDSLLTEANRAIDGYAAKYKDQIVDKKPSKIVVWFKSKKRQLEDMNYDRKDVLTKIDKLDGKIMGKREDLKESTIYIKRLLVANKEAMNKMVGVLAALEAIHLLAQQKAIEKRALLEKTNKDTPQWQDIQDDLARISEVSNAVEQQHSNYMSRSAVARFTNSQVRNLIRTSSNVIMNMNVVHQYTIPLMQQSIAQIGYADTLNNASEASEAVKDANEHSLNILANFNSKVLPGIELQAQKPVISADAINKLSDSAVAGNANVVEAIRRGREARIELEKAVESANAKIQESDMLRDQELVKALLNEKQADDQAVDRFDQIASDAYHSAK